MDTGRREERLRCMETATWKLTLPYVKLIANGNFLYGLENLNRGSVSTKRIGKGREVGGRFKKERIKVHLWLVPVDV